MSRPARTPCRAALGPNPFLEPWFFLPALRAFGPGQAVCVVTVTTPDPKRPFGPRLLSGVFPLRRRRLFRALPVSCATF